MKIPGLCLVVTATLLLTARGDLTIVQKVEGSGSVSQITIKLKGDKVRVEVTPQVATIIENKTGDVITLMNQEKKFLRISADKSKAIAEMASKYAGKTKSAEETVKLTATGRKEMINGYEAEEYVRETPSFKATYWITSKYPDSAAILKQLQSIIPAAWNDVAKGMFDYRDFPGLAIAHEREDERKGDHRHDHFDQAGRLERRGILHPKRFPGNKSSTSPGADGRKTFRFGFTKSVRAAVHSARDSAFHSRLRLAAAAAIAGGGGLRVRGHPACGR